MGCCIFPLQRICIVPVPKLIKKIIETDPCNPEIFEKKGKIYTFLNPVSYLDAINNLSLYDKFDGIFADGYFLTLAIQLRFHKKIKRCSFDMTSLAAKLFSYSQAQNKTLYIIGSKQNEINQFKKIIRIDYPNLNIVGCRNGYFNSEEELDKEVKNIIEKKPNFVLCGMGSIFQEKFLVKLKNSGFTGIAFTCGGFITQTSKSKIMYYPKFFDKLNIRFIYRMIHEKHTRKRYLKAFFCFPMHFFK